MPDSFPPGTKVRVALAAKPVFWTLAIAALVLGLAGFAACMAMNRPDQELIYFFAHQFDFGTEGNFINWYQSITLLGCGLLLAIVGLTRRAAGLPRAAHWFVLAALFAFVAMDEVAQIHEKTLNGFIGALSGDSPAAASETADPQAAMEDAKGGGTWMFVYLPIGIVLVLAYLRFFFALPVRARWGFVFAAVFHLGGAVVMEAIYERASALDGGETPLCYALDAASEFLEMLGVAVLSGTLIAMLGREESELAVGFDPGK